jgi:hypothetical protein
MHKNATKCNETIGKWCKNKHGALKIIDTLETYHAPRAISINTVASSPISIDFTAISTNVAVSHDKEGVVLPRG